MSLQELIDRYSPILKAHWLPISLGFLGLIFFIYGLIALFVGSGQQNEVIFEASESENQSELKTTVVDVAGAVVRPGVYKLESDARVQDALIAAGGLSFAADRAWVAKRLNLAARVEDAQKIYIPAEGESKSSGGSEGRKSSIEGSININTATQTELEGLPGVGAVTAQKIIDSRPYGSTEDLLNKKVVGKSVFEKIKDKVSIY